MGKVRVTKEFSFEMAHTLVGYDGACREIHGHSYRLFVTVFGAPLADESDPKFGMVVDFGDLKRIVSELIVNRYDHAFVIRRTDDNRELTDILKKNYAKLELVDYQPTCENMVIRFAQMIEPALPEGVELFSIKLHETATSFAEWYKCDNR